MTALPHVRGRLLGANGAAMTSPYSIGQWGGSFRSALTPYLAPPLKVRIELLNIIIETQSE